MAGRSSPTVDEATLRRLAVAASADPRTVRKVLRGAPVRGEPRYRIVAALEAAGIPVPPVEEPQP